MLDRLSEVMAWSLKHGKHNANTEGNACVMEAVAYVAGRPWSDTPPCVSPVLGAFMRSWNDALPTDADRNRLLRPFIPKLINTGAADKAIEERRSYLALDWLVRVSTPKWLDLVPSLHAHAKALRELDEIADLAGATAAGITVNAAGDAAGDAAWDAAWDAARAAAWDAARAAAWDAARAAAGTVAWDAVRAAAWAAARDAAWDAAWAAAREDAAGDALKPTIEWLQLSACELVDRMIACGAPKSC